MIHVLGGTYLERCREPEWNFLFGSGLRAAIQLRTMGSRVRLHTLVGKADHTLLLTRAAEHGIEVRASEVPQTILFDYNHGLSTPSILPDPRRNDYPHKLPTVSVDVPNAVCFGFIEGNLEVRGKQVVYDPQSPTKPAPFRGSGCEADQLAIVANRSELFQLSGRTNLESACKRVLANERAEVVVAKLGPAGCLVVTKKTSALVPAFRTKRVFPIGSGDTFSAAFARAWIDEGINPERSARWASKAAALFCESCFPSTRKAVLNSSLRPLRMLPRRDHQQVYLAGPFFNTGQRWVIEELRNSLLNCHLKVFSPLHDVGHGAAETVYAPDMAGLRRSSVVLACLDGLDSGTLYEVGYAHALGHKVIVIVGSERAEDLKMIYGGGCEVVSDLTTAVYLTSWAACCK